MAHCRPTKVVFHKVMGGLHCFHQHGKTRRGTMEKITQHRRDPGIYHGREVTVLLSNGPGQVIVGKVCILPARLGFVTFMPGFLIQVGDGKGTRKTSDGSFAEGHPDFCIERMIVTVPAKDLHVFCAAKSVNGILHQMRKIDTPNTRRKIAQMLHQIATKTDSFE